MGVLCRPLSGPTIGHSNLPAPSLRMAQLFYEFLDRYNEWKMAKRQEMIGKMTILCFGLCTLLIPWFFPDNGTVIDLGVLLLFYYATKRYLEMNERVSHLYVNVHILHHHLIGKLEVGFCDHREPCRCVENFRDYVLREYSISLNSGSLR